MSDEKKPLILVVADDLGRLTYLDSLLGRKGNLITTCSTRADAEKAVAGHKLDLVIVGKMGEEGDENALIWKVKNLSPGTKIIQLVDNPDWAASVAPLNAGADELLSKPYSEEDLLESIQRLLSDRFPPPRPGGATS
jgi:DNA-binding NtrC family response regulator